MENKTVKELREIAKIQKVKYYYRMRREDLMRALQSVVQRPVPAPRPVVQRPVPAPRPVVQRPVPAPRPVVQRPVPSPRPVRSILDEPIPSSASSPVLTPEPAGLFSTLTTAARSVASYVANRYNNIVHWIEPYVPEVVKKKVRDTGIKINKEIESLKSLVFKTVYKNPTAVKKPKIVFKLTNHAVRNVVRQFSYEVQGEERDATSFLNRAREGAIKILRENRDKKVYFVLTSEMESQSILTDEVITRIVPFASKSAIVLGSTNLEKVL